MRRIHVNQGAILENRKGVVFIIRAPDQPTIFCGHVEILGPSELVMTSDHEGRRVFLQTSAAIKYS